MSTEAFPIIFTINSSSRHELLLLRPTSTLATLTISIQSLLTNSPNTAEVLGKYRSKDSPPDEVAEVRVKWAMEGRDRAVWPKETVVTGGNWEAVVEMLKVGMGRDVVDVKVTGEK